ncbi:MAG: 50S ribosomal protein L13 [Patescibacteria group bacterium]
MIKVERKLHKIDATDKTVGRLATNIATILRGKNKPEYQPHLDLGDIVEVSHLEALRFTGKKADQKKYFSYSGYLGGLKTKKISEILAVNPGDVLRRAVREMLPDTKMRVAMLKRLIIK